MIQGILSKDIPKVWEEVEPLISRACEYSNGKYRSGDFYRPLIEADMQLWLNGSAIAITEILQVSHKKVLCFPICAGSDLEAIKKSLEHIEKWGKSKGCDLSRIIGRPGWTRVFKEYDFVQVSMEKEL